jgi:CheY-like chemotaxis protein
VAAGELRRILVVEDDGDVGLIAEAALADVGGFDVKTCASASEGLAAARTFAPDLVLMDVMMPGMDGLSALQALRNDPETAHVPVVLMTARVQPRDVASYTALGCAVIAKPFEPEELPERLLAIWEKRG